MSTSRLQSISFSKISGPLPEETPHKEEPESSQKSLYSAEKLWPLDNSTLGQIDDHDNSEADDLPTSSRRRLIGKRLYCESDSSDEVSSTVKSGMKRKDGTVSSPTRRERVKKRVKVEVPPVRVKKHAIYWYPDGNVVIQIGDTQFRLHRSRLVQQSKFFSALFRSYNQRAHVKGIMAYEAGEVNRHPLFILEGVSLADFETLLAALDDAIAYYFQPPSFHDFAAILRASTSLQFGKLRAWAVGFFERMWPDDLEALDEKELSFAGESVILAEQCNVPRVLKRAFYELLTTEGFGQTESDEKSRSDDEDESEEMDEDIERESEGADEASLGVGDDDSYVDSNKNNTDDKDMEVVEEHKKRKSPFKTQTSTLSSADFLRLVTTREKLTEAWVSGFACTPSTFVCPQEKPCLTASEQQVHWTSLMYEEKTFEVYLLDPVCGIHYLIEHGSWKKVGYCEACIAARIRSWETRRRMLWVQLDTWLSL